MGVLIKYFPSSPKFPMVRGIPLEHSIGSHVEVDHNMTFPAWKARDLVAAAAGITIASTEQRDILLSFPGCSN